MPKTLAILAIAIMAGIASHAQTNIMLGQYFQNMPSYSPAQAGMNDYLDISAGYRQQWIGFQGAPRTVYLSLYNAIKPGNAARTRATRPSQATDVQPTKRAQSKKIGIGGYLVSNNQGPYNQMEAAVTYAYHLPLRKGNYLSLGMAPGIYTAKINLAGYSTKDPSTDPLYLSLQENGYSNTYFNMNVGISLYSDLYYVSYGLMRPTAVLINGKTSLGKEQGSFKHNILGGYRFYLGKKVELLPNAMVRIDPAQPLLYEAGARVRYAYNLWAGVSYRNDNTLATMLGCTINDKIKISINYEYKTSAYLAGQSNGTFGFVLGLQLFNYARYTPIW